MASDIVFVSMALLHATFLGFFSEKGYRMQTFTMIIRKNVE